MWLFSHGQLCAGLSGHIKLPNVFHGCINCSTQAAISIEENNIEVQASKDGPCSVIKCCLYCNTPQASKLILKDICCFSWSFCLVGPFRWVECSVQVFHCILPDAGHHWGFWESIQKSWRCKTVLYLVFWTVRNQLKHESNRLCPLLLSFPYSFHTPPLKSLYSNSGCFCYA